MTQAIKVGDKVRFVCARKHNELPLYYPEVGTIGKVVKVNTDIRVQWQDNTTSFDDLWWCEKDWVEVVE